MIQETTQRHIERTQIYREKYTWRPKNLMIQTKAVIQELSHTIKGPTALRTRMLLTNLMKILDWFESNFPEPDTIDLISLLARPIRMEMLEVHIISNERMINTLITIKEKQHCDIEELNRISNTTLKIILRLKSALALFAHGAKSIRVLDTIIRKLGFDQLNWESEIERLESLEIKICGIFQGNDKNTRELIRIRNLSIKKGQIKEEAARAIIKKEKRSIEQICGTRYIKIQTGEQKDSLKQATVRFLKEVQDNQIMDHPEELRKTTNKEKTQRDTEGEREENRGEESKIHKFQTNKWLMVDSRTLSPPHADLDTLN